MSHPLPPKKEVALALLERSSVHVHLDPRAAGVVVPPWFKRQAQLILQIGLNMAVPIPDLRLDDDGMSCTLSFNRSPFYCVVPWPSVFAIVGEDGRGMVWPDEMPPELTKQESAAEREDRPRAVEDEAAPSKPRGKRAPVVEEVRSDAARPRAVKSKKKKGKGGEAEADARPLLVAVPAPEPTPAPPPSEKNAEKAEKAAEPERPAAARPSPSPAAPNPAKKKRELPPYLRVVK
jgi:stringent starvation protein B